MTGTSSRDVTRLLEKWSKGDKSALDELTPMVHAELRRIARRRLRQERPGHTLQPTALVNEAYLRLVGSDAGFAWRDRAHFFAVCAQVMRRILIDHARGQGRSKRGGGAIRVTFDERAAVAEEPAFDMVALDQALCSLEAVDPQKARIVEVRYFAGLSIEETAEVIGVSAMTIRREWTRAKAWLYRFISEGRPGEVSKVE